MGHSVSSFGKAEVVAISIDDLDESEIRFLKTHLIDLSEVHDGRRQGTGSWKVSAKEGGYDFILTRGRTCAGRHRLKTRAGHCPQCKTSNIAFVRRENANAFVYLASAKNGSIIKVGYARNIYSREETLNKQGYGGIYGWEIISSFKTKYAGRVEREISSIFLGNELFGSYSKDGSIQLATEMFSFNESKALEIFKDYVKLNYNSAVSVRVLRRQ